MQMHIDVGENAPEVSTLDADSDRVTSLRNNPLMIQKCELLKSSHLEDNLDAAKYSRKILSCGKIN